MREGMFALYLKGVAMQIIEDKVYAFSKDNPPCYTARPGEVMVFKSLDCFSGRLTDETFTMRDMDFSYNITNPAAGPVYVEGAEVGDVHATMGDAELCGTGIEIAAEITVRVSVLKNFELHWPVLETFGPAGRWYVNASAQEYNVALVCASKEMQRLLMAITGWDAIDTYMYMSVQSDVEISQGCKPCEVQLSLRIGTPKLPQFPPLVG